MPLRSLPLPPLPLKKKLGAKIDIPQSFVCSSNEKPTWIPRRVSFQRIPGRVLRRGGTTQSSTSTQIYVECFLDWLGELGHLLLLVRWRRYSKNLTKAITEFLHSATTESAENWSKSYFCCKWFEVTRESLSCGTLIALARIYGQSFWSVMTSSVFWCGSTLGFLETDDSDLTNCACR